MSTPQIIPIAMESLGEIFRDPAFNRRIQPLVHPGSDKELGFQVMQSLFDNRQIISGVGEGTENSMEGADCSIDFGIKKSDLYILLEMHYHPTGGVAPSVYEMGAGDLYRLNSLRKGYQSLFGVDIRPVTFILAYRGGGKTSILGVQEEEDILMSNAELLELNKHLYADFSYFHEPHIVQQRLSNTGKYKAEVLDVKTTSLFPVQFEINGLEKLATFSFQPKLVNPEKLKQVYEWSQRES